MKLIDYDIDNEAVHAARILLGDPMAESVDVLKKYAARINKLNEGTTSYGVHHILQVMSQNTNLPVHERVALGHTAPSVTDYWPNLQEAEALNKILKGNRTVTRDDMFTQIDRGIGRSIRQAHKIAGYLLANPGKWVLVQDHYDTSESNLELAKLVQHMLSSFKIAVTIQHFSDPNSLGRIYKAQIDPVNKPKVLK